MMYLRFVSRFMGPINGSPDFYSDLGNNKDDSDSDCITIGNIVVDLPNSKLAQSCQL